MRLLNALTQIDGELERKISKCEDRKADKMKSEESETKLKKGIGSRRVLTWTEGVPGRMSMAEAVKKTGHRVPLKDACGCVSRGFLTVYPPGVPAVVPGEIISLETAELLLENTSLGLTVEGIDSDGKIDAVENEEIAACMKERRQGEEGTRS